MYRKFICFALAWVMLQTVAHALSAQSAILIDAHTGRVLMSQNAYSKMGMASTTKIMTALVAIENCDVNDTVTVSATAAGVEGSSMYLKGGEKITLRDLLYGLMLCSGNDAATAIAEHISGSVPEFAALMNEKAASLGLKNTSFTNPHGLDDTDHYTTAYDLAQITRYALSNQLFSEIVSTRLITIGTQEGENIRTLCNHNKLLVNYKGADGVKTGFTKKSGRCLVSSATREGLKLIAVTLNAPNDWKDHGEMLDYGFSQYRRKVAIREGDYMRTVPVIGSDADTVSLYAAEGAEMAVNGNEKIRILYDVPSFVYAPIEDGEVLGSAKIFMDDEMIKTVDLVVKGEAPLTDANRFKKAFTLMAKELLELVIG
ncbi:MAG: D-alanyl-D-alanine carboxypeptidase DacB precursor [Firmicutes bacterium ADurb.Bin193]|nr:MAG: D-alanyl-D-alanine carboxypeptidase DacB precursor [Firmicutes bacterium ADurb.Bin193]